MVYGTPNFFELRIKTGRIKKKINSELLRTYELYGLLLDDVYECECSIAKNAY